jgi:hypothetical protein
MVKGNFDHADIFLFEKEGPSLILLTCSVLHAIRSYRSQRGQNRLPFATTTQVI